MLWLPWAVRLALLFLSLTFLFFPSLFFYLPLSEEGKEKALAVEKCFFKNSSKTLSFSTLTTIRKLKINLNFH
jgi:ABC-type Fe3+ transport system permease subunit